MRTRYMSCIGGFNVRQGKCSRLLIAATDLWRCAIGYVTMDLEKINRIYEQLKIRRMRTFIFIVGFFLVTAIVAYEEGYFMQKGKQFAVAPADTNRTKKNERIDPFFDLVLVEYPELRRRLGVPITPVRNKSVVLQHYTKGFMIWLYENSLNIYVFFDDGQRWSKYKHLTLSSEELKLFESLKPEIKDKFDPDGGFKQVWLRYKLVDVIGVPLVQELAIQSPAVQNFQNGILIRDVPWFNRTNRRYIPVGPGKTILILIVTKDNKKEWKLIG